jgi:hypothetical protein
VWCWLLENWDAILYSEKDALATFTREEINITNESRSRPFDKLANTYYNSPTNKKARPVTILTKPLIIDLTKAKPTVLTTKDLKALLSVNLKEP